MCVCVLGGVLLEGRSVSKPHLQPLAILVQFRGIDYIPNESVLFNSAKEIVTWGKSQG